VPEVLYLSFPLRESHVGIGLQILVAPASFRALLESCGIGGGNGGYLASLGADAGLQTLYLEGMSFSTTATQTDTTGTAIIANVPAGPVEVFANPVRLGRASSHLPVNVEPGKVTVVLLFPD
jgi:hypothetical protein